MLNFRLLFTLLMVLNLSLAQERVPPPPCYANGNTGAGGPIGPGLFLHNYFDDDIILYFNSQQEEVLFDGLLVIYISTGAPGRDVIDDTIDDASDSYRIAITNSNAFGLGSTISFPPGFAASYAIAIDSNSGGLYSIPSSGIVGDGGLTFITSVNSTMASNTQPYFDIDFKASDIGLANEEEFYFVATYVGQDGYTYDEGYGDGILEGTQGSDDIIFTGARALSNDVGCRDVLSIAESNFNTIEASYVKNKLHIHGIEGEVKIEAFDILGRKIRFTHHRVNGQAIIPFNLPGNQLHFIIVESSNKRKVLKVVPD